MRNLSKLAPAVVVFVALVAAQTALAGGRWAFGVSIGGPVYYRPYPYYYPYYYYPYRPVYVEPTPVIVQQPAPVVVQSAPPAPVYQTPPTTASAAPVAVHSVASEPAPAEVDQYLRQLADPNENVRIDSVMQLGKLRASRATDPLAATLAGDQSPRVRETAARALALIGSPNALPALQRAALADSDHDVRRSAQFAVDIIQQQGR